MSLRFHTHCSSSAGNCIQLSCEGATLLVDCGFSSQRGCEAALAKSGEVAGVVVSHIHTDHVSYSGLRVLARRGIAVHADAFLLRQMEQKFGVMAGARWGALAGAQGRELAVGPFAVRAVRVLHDPRAPNCGFVVRCGGRKIVLCTDFYSPAAMAEECVDADLLYIEANHDLELLERHPNFASRYHLSNPQAAALLVHALGQSERGPQAIVLGHLSEERNRPELAMEEVRTGLAAAGLRCEGRLMAAPARVASGEIVVE